MAIELDFRLEVGKDTERPVALDEFMKFAQLGMIAAL